MAELLSALSTMKGSAPGPDRVTAKELLGLDKSMILTYVNLLLRYQHIPKTLKCARITLKKKCRDATSPGDFRPISVTSVLCRAITKILANRWMKTIPLQHDQSAFLQKDGCLEATATKYPTPRSTTRLLSACAGQPWPHEGIRQHFSNCYTQSPTRNGNAWTLHKPHWRSIRWSK